MSRVRASVVLDGRISEAEELWYDLKRRPAFVDGFSHVVRRDDDWPASGELVWQSKPHGRGRVIERVMQYELRAGQRAEVEDERLKGVQSVEFEGITHDETRVTLTLDYSLKDRNALSPVVDLFFIRRSLRDSLERTLDRLAAERRGDAQLLT